MPQFSVIVPVYKAEKTLDRCLKSILEQTFSDFEVILVDDGSPDRSGAMCDTYMKRDSRVRAVHKENGGPSSARNEGLDRAAGDWIVFCDADDEMERDALEKYSRASRETGADVVIADISRAADGQTERLRLFGMQLLIDNPGDKDKLIAVTMCDRLNAWPASRIAWRGYGSVVNRAYRREILARNSIRFEKSLNRMEDRLFNIRVYCSADKIVYVPENVYYYIASAGSLTVGCDLNLVEQNNRIIQKVQEFAAEQGKLAKWRHIIDAMTVERLMMLYKQYIFHSGSCLTEKKRRNVFRMLMDNKDYRHALFSVDVTAYDLASKLVILASKMKLYAALKLIYTLRAMIP